MAGRRKGEDGLSLQEGLFVEHYLATNLNGTEAARRAGYSEGTEEGLRVQASRVLARANVQEALAEKRKAIAMDALEVIQRHSEIARCSLDDFIDPVTKEVDLDRARALGKLHLLKEITYDTAMTTDQEGKPVAKVYVDKIKLYDAQAAQVTLMKYHGLLTEILALRELPKTEDELVGMAMREIQRVSGAHETAKPEKVKA